MDATNNAKMNKPQVVVLEIHLGMIKISFWIDQVRPKRTTIQRKRLQLYQSVITVAVGSYWN